MVAKQLKSRISKISFSSKLAGRYGLNHGVIKNRNIGVFKMNDFANKILGTRVNHKILGTSIVFSLTNQDLSFNNSCQDQPAAWLKPKSDFSQLRNQVLRDFFHVNEFSSTNFPCHQVKVPLHVT